MLQTPLLGRTDPLRDGLELHIGRGQRPLRHKRRPQIRTALAVVREALPATPLGIHCHDDAGCAVANTLTAVEAGATQVQGTANGIGGRTSNANLITIIADLQLKLGAQLLADEQLAKLTETAHFIDELLNRTPNPAQPYVGKHAFAHKAGMHAAGVRADAQTFEHVQPELGQKEERAVIEVLRSGQLSLGPKFGEFERLFAERVGAASASAVLSGTAGLHLPLRAAGVGLGDEVITSPFSFVASANAILYCGATPVFADIDPVTLNLDPAAAEAAITPRTKGDSARAHLYREALAGIDGLGLPCPDQGGDVRGWFVFVVQLPPRADRAAVIRELGEAGIQSKPYLPAIHLMSFYGRVLGLSPR